LRTNTWAIIFHAVGKLEVDPLFCNYEKIAKKRTSFDVVIEGWWYHSDKESLF